MKNAETDVDQTWQARPRGVTLYKWLAFGDDPDPRVDSGSLFYFLYHCGIRDFWTFVSISLTVNGRFVPYLAK